ncbi:hypothetical protein ACJ73_00728 [Blastomyces percursus]|uniref:Uncharacterized protein n=1 Tax=Blastomyces percursus TaxID=1658174 RepID=A0A1J9RJU4_9EURO|nr:hypothetical protein ACJ73_00728 [Blastomyces percursus]
MGSGAIPGYQDPCDSIQKARKDKKEQATERQLSLIAYLIVQLPNECPELTLVAVRSIQEEMPAKKNDIRSAHLIAETPPWKVGTRCPAQSGLRRRPGTEGEQDNEHYSIVHSWRRLLVVCNV